MLIQGQDIIDFYAAWPPGDGYCVDDDPFIEDDGGALCLQGGQTPVDPARMYEVYGVIFWDGTGPEPTPAYFTDDLEEAIRSWSATRDFATLIVQVPKDQAEAARQLLAEHGWSVR